MDTRPIVSVLLPVRDGAAHLEEALASLERQTLADLEVIAVDDGSTDATPEILSAWAARDRRVRVLTQPAAGIVAALERARARARGPYLARMDADDLSEPTRLAEQLALMRTDPSLDGCGCGVRYFPEELVREGALRYEGWLNAAVSSDEISRDVFVECPLAHPTFFLRADAVERVGGYVDRGWPEDYDLLLRLWGAGGRLAKVPEPLLRWREGLDRLSRTDPRYGPEAFLACKIHHLRRTLLVRPDVPGGASGGGGARDGRGSRVAVIWGAGPVGKAVARALLAANVEVRAFVELDPRKIGQEIHGAPVLDLEAGVRVDGRGRPPLHLAAVGQPGARERIRSTLGEAGLRELEDFVAVA